ncbi:hypothetical protein D3C81_1460820 [compost metagenome]
MRFVFVLADQLFNLVALTGDDLHRCLVVLLTIGVFEGFIEQGFHTLGVGLVDAEHHGFFFAERVQLVCQGITDHFVESRRDDAAVERLDVEVEFVLQLGDIDFAGLGIDDADRFAFLKADAVFTQLRFVADRRFVVDQPVICHGFAVAVGEHRLTENFTGVFGRGSGQSDFAGVEIIQYAAVL